MGEEAMKRLGRTTLTAALILSVMVSFGWAPAKPATAAPVPLDDCIPADAMLYVYYQGLAQAKASFQKTALSDILAEPEVQVFGKELSRFMDELIRKNMPQSPMSWQDIRMLLDFEMAYALLDVRQAPPSMMLIVRPAGAADKLHVLVDRLIATVVPPDQPVPQDELDGIPYKQVGPFTVAWKGDELILTTTLDTFRKVNRVLKGADVSMAHNDRFKTVSMKTMGGKAFLMAHWDVEKTRQILAEAHPADAEADRAWASTGFKNVDRLHLSIVPDAPGIKVMVYARAPAGVQGLLRLLPTKPVDEKTLLANVPENTSDFFIGRLGAADVFDAIAQMVSFTPDKDGFNAGIAAFNRRVGFDLRKSLLASLGDDLSVRTIGPGFLWVPEFSLSVAVKDEKTLAACLEKTLAVAAEEVAGAERARWTLQTEKLDYKGVQITVCKFVGIPVPSSPSYATRGGRMFLALTPQGLKRALDADTAPARSILVSNAYVALRTHVSAKPGMLTYGEFKQGFDQLYAGLLPFLVQMTNGIPDVPPHSLGTKFPSANAVAPHLFGTLSAVSYDGEGYLMESYGPFGLMTTSAGSSDSLVMAGFLLPALAKAQEAARRASCMNNIRQIGLAMIQYAGDNDDKFPPSFGVLLKQGYLTTPKVFYCPSGGAMPPPDFPQDLKNADVDEMNALLANSSYVMVKGITHAADVNAVVVYEKEGAHGNEGLNCFFNDGHVQWLTQDMFQQLAEEQKLNP